MTNLVALNKILTEKLEGTEEGKTLLDTLNLIVKNYGGDGDAVNNAQALKQLYSVFYKGEILPPYEGETEVTPSAEDQVLDTENKKVLSNITVKAIEPVYGTDLNPAEYEITEEAEAGTAENVLIFDDTKDKFLRASTKAEGWYKEGAKGLNGVKVKISDEEKAKLTPANIVRGQNILGVEGDYFVVGFDMSKTGALFSSKLTELSVKYLNFSNVTSMDEMFVGCSALTTLDLSNFDTSNVTSMDSMFGSCKALTTLDLSNFDTSNVTGMQLMFSNCRGLTTLDLSNFDTSNVTSMARMFYDCMALTTLDLSNFDTSKVTNMDSMFFECSALTTLDLSNFDTSKVTNMPNSIFFDCSALTTATWGSNWGSNEAMTRFDVSACPLSHDSCLDLLNKLATKTTTATLKLSATTKSYMSDDEIAIATAKGWTIA